MNSRGYAQNYARTGVTGAVLNASPHKQVSLMLDGVRKALQRAAASIEANNIPSKGEAIKRASAIIAELDATLDHKAGGEVAAGLGKLYDYSLRRLVTANAHNDVAILKHLDKLFVEIEDSWNAIGEAGAP